MDKLINTIQEIANRLLNGSGSFIYARAGEYSLDHDKPSPHIVFFNGTGQIEQSTLVINGIFMFAEPNPDTQTREEGREIAKRMLNLAIRFFQELNSNEFDNIQCLETRLNFDELNKEFQTRVTGVAYRVNLSIPINWEIECYE